MNKCLNCGKDVIQKEGRRQRLYCSDTCRVKANRQKHGGKVRWVSVEKYNELLERVAKNNEPEIKSKIMAERAGSGGAKTEHKNPLTPSEATKHPLWKEGDPKEGSGGFFMRYGVSTYDELEKSKNK